MSGDAALTAGERLDLQALEHVVRDGLRTFIEVGEALAEIRDRRLYRATHGTFEDYCRERWELGRTRAYQLIDAARVDAALSTVVDMPPPANEAQTRELAPVLRDEGEQAVVDVWRELRAEHGDDVTAEKVRSAVGDRLRLDGRVRVMASSLSAEWYTPGKYIEAAREVLGGIDLDPASCAEANETVRATGYYTPAEDGLSRDWSGTVWLNPPYGPLAGQFVSKLLAEHHTARVPAAVLLLNAHATDTDWFRPLFEHTLCFTDHRLDFYGPMGGGNSTHGSVFVYVGAEWDRFAERFAAFGSVVMGTNRLVRARSCICAGDYYSRLGREAAA